MGRPRLSSLEVFLTVLSCLLLICCVALVIVSWLSLRPEGAPEPAVASGRMVITGGAEFSEELRNSSSVAFKVLAFDVHQLVSDAFGVSDLRRVFRSCRVLGFSQGSVVVTFDLWLERPVDVSEVERQLEAGLDQVDGRGLVIDRSSIHIAETHDEFTTAMPTPTVTATCAPGQRLCSDWSRCLPIDRFCDGVVDCPDGSDEDSALCATTCDGQFVLSGVGGAFASSAGSDAYDENSRCRWIIRVEPGLSVKITFLHFETEDIIDNVKIYEGVGGARRLTAELSGSAPPGTVWILSDRSTVEFVSDDVIQLSGFNATYDAVNTTEFTDVDKLTCMFEDGLCFWRQRLDDDDEDWIRTRGATFPPLTGPTVDHTLGNSSGFYITTPMSPGQWLKSFKIYSLPLAPPTQPSCLTFWYHMFGEDVHRLRLLLTSASASIVLFQKDGNFGDNWNYGQVTLNLTDTATVEFEALKEGGMRNDVALDDIALTFGPCGPAPPDPTTVPPPTTPPPIPPDCGGPFDLWEPNSTFGSPNYPHSYGHRSQCLWTLHTSPGQNIQLHFLDFDVEATYDMVEVRDGAGSDSTLLAVLTGTGGPAHDLFSTANQMTVWFYTDSSGHGRGFQANFTSGSALGSPPPCAADQFQCGTGSCIHAKGQCNAVVECPDGSDEADCVELQVNGSNRLQFQLISALHTVCADTWTSDLSVFTCLYLGHRSGESSTLPSVPQDSPFVLVTVSTNGTLETKVSDTCSSGKVISLTCDNKSCGRRHIANLSRETDQSEERTQSDTDETRVVGGANAAKGAWPWIASLKWRGRHACGASLIGRDWLITAAHCVYGKNVHIHLWEAELGLHAQSDADAEEVQTRRVDGVVIHPRYDRRSKDADVALMHLQHPLNLTEWVEPVCLPADGDDITAGQKCLIAGWGRDTEGFLPDVLQEAQVPLLDQAQCQRLLPEFNITSSMVCAGLPEGGVDTCQGDSGGPLVVQEDGLWTLIGVTSFGIGCGLPQRPGVYARVSAFSSWIAETRRSSFLT